MTGIVTALFVETDGVYYGLDGVDPWDEQRDARLYNGPWPVVAHPPCKRWSRLGLCRGYYDGQDGGCFESALRAVRTFGGVLEHPKYTLAWKRFGLARPAAYGWTQTFDDHGWTCEVDQGNYDYGCRKPTWLYYVGPQPPPALIWGQSRHRLSVANFAGGEKGEGHSRSTRSATPPAFRNLLLHMARSALAPHVTEFVA